MKDYVLFDEIKLILPWEVEKEVCEISNPCY